MRSQRVESKEVSVVVRVMLKNLLNAIGLKYSKKREFEVMRTLRVKYGEKRMSPQNIAKEVIVFVARLVR